MLYKSYLIAFLLLLSIILQVISSSSSSSPSSQGEKYDLLKKTSEKTQQNIITLNDQSYSSFVIDDNVRSYQTIVLLTASHPKFRCSICKQVEDNFKLTASSYASHIQKEGLEPDTFFIKIDYSDSSSTFNKYGISSVPMVFYISPHHGMEDFADPYNIDDRDKYLASSSTPDVDSMANFVMEKTKMSFTINKPMFFVYLNLALFITIIVMLIRPIINSIEFWISMIQIKGIWVTISIGVYVCAISGLIFDIIRSPPMYYVNPQTRQAMYFYPQQGNQFVVEGFIIGFLNLMCGGSLVFLAAVAPSLSPKLRSGAVIVSSIAFVFCFTLVRNFYKMKNQWYSA